MSVNRYVLGVENGCFFCREDPKGVFVGAPDYDAIAAERDALKARNAALEAKIPDSGQYREYDDLIVERDAAQAALAAFIEGRVVDMRATVIAGRAVFT